MEYWLQSAADAAAGERSCKYSTRLCLVVRADDAVAYACAVGFQKEGLHRVLAAVGCCQSHVWRALSAAPSIGDCPHECTLSSLACGQDINACWVLGECKCSVPKRIISFLSKGPPSQLFLVSKEGSCRGSWDAGRRPASAQTILAMSMMSLLCNSVVYCSVAYITCRGSRDAGRGNRAQRGLPGSASAAAAAGGCARGGHHRAGRGRAKPSPEPGSEHRPRAGRAAAIAGDADNAGHAASRCALPPSSVLTRFV